MIESKQFIMWHKASNPWQIIVLMCAGVKSNAQRQQYGFPAAVVRTEFCDLLKCIASPSFEVRGIHIALAVKGRPD